MPNAVVAQSGGPSPVINASLQGVIDACSDFPETIGRIFAARHGVEGLLREELLDLGPVPREEIARLRHTPSAGVVGTCRYKLSDEQREDFHRIVDVFAAHAIGYFFYIGGNDSMDTAAKLAHLAERRGLETRVVGVPKTIDNDIGDAEFRLIDHTPGYGSAARYWAYTTQILDQENRGMSPSECVCVTQAMGRGAGFIPAAARLGDPNREIPLQLYLPECSHTLDSLADNVADELRRSGRCVVVVSEGFDVGSLGEVHDAFGHIEYGASKMTVAQVVVNRLNSVGLPARGTATAQVPGVLQRSTSAFASAVDQEEAYQVGRKAVELGVAGETGVMATILRRARMSGYEVYYDKVWLPDVANSVRHLPSEWLMPDELDVTDDFVRYAQPLIGETWPNLPLVDGIQRFARIKPVPVDKKLAPYVPMTHR